MGEHVTENHDPCLGLMTMYSRQLELTQKYLNSMVINSNRKGAGHYEFISGKIKVSLFLKISYMVVNEIILTIQKCVKQNFPFSFFIEVSILKIYFYVVYKYICTYACICMVCTI